MCSSLSNWLSIQPTCQLLTFYLFHLSPTLLLAQSAHSQLRDGNTAYKKGDYTVAEQHYREALKKTPTVKSAYNLANTQMQQQRLDEAIKQYETVLSNTKDSNVKAKAFHNLGNAYFQKKELDKSIAAYKDALRLNPSDMETKQNLALAMRERESKKDSEKESKKDREKESEKGKKEGEKEKDKKPGEKGEDKQNEDKERKDDGNKEGENNPSQQKQNSQQGNATKEQAKQLLQIMDKEEQKVQEKMRKHGAIGKCRKGGNREKIGRNQFKNSILKNSKIQF